MNRIERSIEISRSPEEVFELLTDLERLPQWATILVETRKAPGRPLEPGDTFEQTIRVAGVPLESRWRVLRIERPRVVEYEAEGVAGGRLKMTQRVSPAAAASRVELEVEYELPGGFVGELLDRAFVERRNEREAESSLQNLKDLLESGRTG